MKAASRLEEGEEGCGGSPGPQVQGDLGEITVSRGVQIRLGEADAEAGGAMFKMEDAPADGVGGVGRQVAGDQGDQ